MADLYDSPDAPLVPFPRELREPQVPLTAQQKRAGIAEAVMRASFEMPQMGADEVARVVGSWQPGEGGSLGVFVQGETVSGGIVFAKHYDDLSVLGQIRITRK